MSVVVVQWSRCCLHVQMNQAKPFSVSLLYNFFCSFCFLILFFPLAGFPLFLLLTLYSFALRGFCDNVFLVRADCVVVLICLKLLINCCLLPRDYKGDREGIPHIHPIPQVIRLELFLTPQVSRGIRQQPITQRECVPRR